jgi:hypothetical protein
MTTHPHRPRCGTREQIAHVYCQDQLAESVALAEPRPSTVTLAHFLLRNMNDDLAAGCCTVTCVHRLFASAPRLNVTQVRYLPGKMPAYIIVTDKGYEWQTYSGLEHLAVTWLDVPDDWDTLSQPMHLALKFLVGDYNHKPRWNTLRALEQRGHVADGTLTASGRSLYMIHREAFND